MNDETNLSERKLRVLGNILLIVACIGLIAGLAMVPISFTSQFSDLTGLEDPEVREAIDEVSELFLPEGLTLESSVRDLIKHDREFLANNHSMYRNLSLLSAAFILLSAFIFLRLALDWRKAIPFGRPAIIGLRCLGLLLVVQFVVSSIVLVLVPEPWHRELFLMSELHYSPVDFFIGGGPILSSGILFLILSWVLDYGRKIKDEQAFTI